jgi:hypothetical protein
VRAAQHNAALSRNQLELSVNAPEFIPKFSAPIGADWNSHPQQHPPQVFAQSSRPFPPQHQQIPFAGPSQQQRSQYVYPQQSRNYAGSRHDAGQQNHHNHYPNYSNNHHAPQSHVIQASSHVANVYQHRGGSGNGIQNRLNSSSIDTAPVQPQQVI